LCFIHEVDSQERYAGTMRGLTTPAEMTQVIHCFLPNMFTRELPTYPPQHFFDVT
jgi:hypothetical protein